MGRLPATCLHPHRGLAGRLLLLPPGPAAEPCSGLQRRPLSEGPLSKSARISKQQTPACSGWAGCDHPSLQLLLIKFQLWDLQPGGRAVGISRSVLDLRRTSLVLEPLQGVKRPALRPQSQAHPGREEERTGSTGLVATTGPPRCALHCWLGHQASMTKGPAGTTPQKAAGETWPSRGQEGKEQCDWRGTSPPPPPSVHREEMCWKGAGEHCLPRGK